MAYYRVESVRFSVPCEHGPDGECGARLTEGGPLVHDRSGYTIWDVELNAPWSSKVIDTRREADALAAELELDREPRPHRSARGADRTGVYLGERRDV